MKNPRDLKRMSRKVLQGHYGTACGAVLITYLVAFAVLIPLMAITTFHMYSVVPYTAGRYSYFNQSGMMYILRCVMFWLCAMIGGIAAGMLTVGVNRICFQICVGGSARMSDLLFGLTRHPLRHLGVIVLQGLIGFCCYIPYLLLLLLGILLSRTVDPARTAAMGNVATLLTVLGVILEIVLGCSVVLRFLLAGVILVEDPERTVMDCMRTSWRLLKGNTWRYIRMHLSFIGVALTGAASFYLGFLWIIPYYTCTNIYFYRELKQEADTGRYDQKNPSGQPYWHMEPDGTWHYGA